MAENLTLARPYAEAAFALARSGQSQGLTAWSAALKRVAAVAARPEMAECVGNPRFSAEQIAGLCLDVAGSDLTPEQQNFVRVLVANDRLAVAAEVADLFDDLRNRHEGVKEAVVTSAFALDAGATAELVAALERKLGCKVQARVELDPQLIGGVRIAIGDEVIDASVRGKLAAMATALKN